MAVTVRIPARVKLRIEAGQTWSSLLTWTRQHESPRWLFRGQGQKWTLKPTVGRLAAYDPARELQLFDEFRRLASPFVDRSAVSSDWDWLFVAQHHGLPTRLLDWTTNPLVSAYFACQPSPRGKRNGEIIAIEAASVPSIDTRIAPSPFGLVKPGLVYPTALAARISAQRGLFSIHPQPDKPWILKNKTDRFDIPAAQKEILLGFLAGVGVDAAMVMADMDGLASNLRWRYRTGRGIQ